MWDSATLDGISDHGFRQRGSHASAPSATSTADIHPHPFSAYWLNPQAAPWIIHCGLNQPWSYVVRGHHSRASQPVYTCSAPREGTIVPCFLTPHLVSMFLPSSRESKSKYAMSSVSGQRESSSVAVLSQSALRCSSALQQQTHVHHHGGRLISIVTLTL